MRGENNKMVFTRRRVAFCIAFIFSLVFVIAFKFRVLITPLHWAAFWFLLVALYCTIGLCFKPPRSFKLLGILFPVALVALIEGTWNLSQFLGERVFQSSLPPGGMERGLTTGSSEGRVLQAEVDFIYRDITLDFHFMPDAIRLISPPPNFRSSVVNTNSLGFRAKEFTPKESDTYRVIMFGDSGLFGWNAPNDQSTIPWFLEQTIKRYVGPASKVEVLNLGVGSANAAIHYPTFATYGQALNPDLVIMYLGLNDLHGGSAVIADGIYSKRIQKHFLNYTVMSQLGYLFGQFFGTVDLLARRMKLYSALAPKKDPFRLVYPDSEKFDVWKNAYISNLEKIYILASKLKIPVLTFEQLSSRLALSMTSDLNVREQIRKRDLIDNRSYSWQTGDEAHYDLVVNDGNRIAQKYGFAHVGLKNILKEHVGPILQGQYVGLPNKSFFVSDAHYTPYGNKRIAEQIFKNTKHLIDGKLGLN